MIMPPRVRKFALTVHITTSVSWIGGLVVVLALGGVALTTGDPQTLRATYLAMVPITWLVLVPVACAALVTGVIQSLGTAWGLVRHYWVVFKLVINVVAVLVLLLYTRTLDDTASVAADPTASEAELRALAFSPMIHATLALLSLLVATALAVFKPRGRTRYGQRKQHRQRRQRQRSRHRESSFHTDTAGEPLSGATHPRSNHARRP